MAPHYQLPEPAAMPVPSLTGRFLAHNQETRVVRAFLAADLHAGVKRGSISRRACRRRSWRA